MAPMERQQRRHVSFSGVILPAALVLVATLASITVLVGMRFTTASTHYADANHIISRFREEEIVYHKPHAHSLYNGRNQINDGIVSDEAESMRVRVGPGSNEKKHPRVTSINGNQGDWTDHLRGEADSKKRVIAVSKTALKEQQRLVKSNDFSYRDPLHEGECEPMQPWQETSFPNCNLFHELDYRGKAVTAEFEFYDNGGYNQIFWMTERDKGDDPELVLKILHWGTAYSDRNYDRVRRDGLILERLTQSPYVLDSYGFCGFEVLTPYADGGTFIHRMMQWQRRKLKLSPKTRLRYAMETAAGLADVHDIDGEGLSSVSHGDLKGSQYLFLNGTLKLGDFNRGRFLRRNATAPDTACTYTIGKNDAAFRSPEEYEYLPQTSAIDVWALGKEVWHGTDIKKAQKYIRQGKLPTIEDKYMGDDPVDVTLREAINMCFIFDPKERAKAGEVAAFLREKFLEMA